MSQTISNLLKEHYRNHELSFRETSQLCVGEVFKDNERLAYCESVDIDNARQYCRQIVDEYLFKQSAENTHGLPDLTDLIKAMQAIHSQIDAPCHNLLLTHLRRSNEAIAINHLKKLGGFDSTTAVFLRYAEWARQLCDALAYLPPPQSSGKDPYLSMVINSEEPETSGSGGLTISLKPVIYEALSHISQL